MPISHLTTADRLRAVELEQARGDGARRATTNATQLVAVTCAIGSLILALSGRL